MQRVNVIEAAFLEHLEQTKVSLWFIQIEPKPKHLREIGISARKVCIFIDANIFMTKRIRIFTIIHSVFILAINSLFFEL